MVGTPLVRPVRAAWMSILWEPYLSGCSRSKGIRWGGRERGREGEEERRRKGEKGPKERGGERERERER